MAATVYDILLLFWGDETIAATHLEILFAAPDMDEQQAINAGFNLFTGMYEDHANVDTKAIYADMVSLNNVRRHFRSKTKKKSNFPWFFAR
jgi:hypothetical protein